MRPHPNPLQGQTLSIFSILGPERAKKLSIGLHGFAENRENRQPQDRERELEGGGGGEMAQAETMELAKRNTRRVRIGDVTMGGEAPVVGQSRCAARTIDIGQTVAQSRH